MSKKLYEESNIQGIASAIREKNGTQNQYTVAKMPDAVRAIQTQPDLETLNATENGNYVPSAGKDGFNEVNVNVEGGEAVVRPLSVTQNGTYTPPSGVDGYAPITVNVSGGGGGGNLYTNNQFCQSEEQITDITGYTLLYNGSIGFGSNGQKVAARLDITDENAHSTLQANGWTASEMAYYDTENLIGAYGGYNFGEAILISKAKFWLNRYNAQNQTLIVTVEYLDGNGNWNEIQDLEITVSMSYPSYVFEVLVGRSVYGIRWIHKKEPRKSLANNITFAGMSVYRGLGQPINIYKPDSSGIIMPPTGYDGFGPLYISN